MIRPRPFTFMPQTGSCRFCDLALAYFPDSPSRRAASVRLRRWIKADRQLREGLTEAGWVPGKRTFTPRQRGVFVRILGEP